MKKSKRIISLLLSVLMLMSVVQTGFVAFAADASVQSTDAAILPNAGAVTTASQVVRVASGLYSYEPGNVIVPATESGVPVMSTGYEENSVANAGDVNEVASYPSVKITFEDLPDNVPIIKCIADSAENVVMSAAIFNETEKSYTWLLSSGKVNEGETLQYKISYTYEGKSYVSTAYSYVESIAQPAGVYAQTTSTYKSGVFGWGDAYRSSVIVASRVLGINTYGSLETFTTSSSEYRGYYNASANAFVMRSNDVFSTYSIIAGEETKDEDIAQTYFLNSRRSYADVYVDTSVTNSFSDLNLRYAITMPTTSGDGTTQNLEFVSAVKGYAEASLGVEGTGVYDLGVKSATGVMNAVGSGGTSQYVTTFTGNVFENNQEYTLVAKITSEAEGAANITSFPVGLRIHAVDKGELRTLINDILHENTPETALVSAKNKGVNPQSWYYSDGFEEYEAAMLSAQTVLVNPRSTAEEISSAVASLSAAYEGLVLETADYSGVNAAIAEAAAYVDDEALYTEETFAALENAISVYDANTNPDGVINTSYSILFQPQVDEWEKAIYAAIEGLEYKLADYTALDEAYAKAEEAATHKDDYFDFSAVEAAMKAVDRNVSIINQSEVDKMTDNINEALNNLKYKLANYDAVNEAVSKAQTYSSNHYSDDSFKALRSVLMSIDYSLDLSQQATVDNYVVQIEEAIANLDELDADYTRVEALLKEIDGLVEEYYEPESYNAAKEAAAACADYKEIKITRQTEIDAMADSLQTAVDNLVMYDADYSEIDALIKRYNETDTSQMSQGSINAVESAIEAVQYGLKVDKQSEVDKAAEALYTAIENLEYMPADYSAVTLALEKASSIDRSRYSAETLAALDEAVDAVIYGYGVNKQAEVDQMAARIDAAREGLLPGPADYSGVQSEIDRFNELNHSHYTQESINRVQVIIQGIVWDKTIEQQADVVKYELELFKAISALVEAKAYYTDLERIVSTIPSEAEAAELYTTESYEDLLDIYEDINWDLKAKDQDIVTSYQDAILEGIANLKYKVGDYSDVDAAIEEGRAIIAKNDPPISKESAEAFEAYVASINRTYTIMQTSEITALAAQIRAEYAKFTYAESVHKASVELSSDRTATYPGDIVTVSVIVETDYYAAASSFPILYDSEYLTLLSTDISETCVFDGSYALGSDTSGSTFASPSKAYPSSYTAEMQERWKIALISFTPNSKINPEAQILSPAQTVVQIKFKVNEDISDMGENGCTARVYIDSQFLKSDTYKLGKLYIGRFENSMVDNNVVALGQTIDVTAADIDVTITDPDSPANFTLLKAAIVKTPAYESSFYVEDTYTAYSEALAAAREVLTYEGEYTVKEQTIVDNAVKALNAAYASLELKEADTTPLEEALLLTPANPSDYYTESSYKNFTDAKAAGEAILAEESLTIADNDRINAAAELIISTHGALTLRPFSYIPEMDSALEKEVPYPQSYYTEDSYSSYAEAYDALVAFKASDPTFLNDDEGLDLILTLQDAYSSLKLLDADKSSLKVELETELEYPVNYYTEDSYSMYKEAYEIGKELYDDESLTIVDNDTIAQAASLIAETREVLEFMPFSYEEEVYAAFELYYDESYEYTDESIDAFWTAYDNLAIFEWEDIRQDEEALRLIAELEDALNNMQLLPADTALLEEALALEVLDESYYTQSSYAAYKAAVDAVAEYGEDYYWTYLEQDTLDELANAIIDAHSELAFASFTMVDELKAALEVLPEYSEEYYQPEAYQAYLDARADIEDMIADADNLTKKDDESALVLIDAYNAALETLKTAWADADYTAVEDAIAKAEELDREIYTNFEIVDNAIAAVDYTLNIHAQDEVQAYADEIYAAIKKLEYIDGNYDVVYAAIENYDAKLEEMNSTGIEIKKSTIDAVDAAVAAVVEGLKYDRQADIQKFADDINAAVEKLDYVSTIVLKQGEDHTGYITEDGYLRGLHWLNDEVNITDEFAVYGNTTKLVVVRNENNGCGTGAVLQHYDEDVLVAEYVIVVDGDYDGSGFVDADDITCMVTLLNNAFDPETEAQLLAVDLCEDGWLDAIDLTILITMSNSMEF